MTEKKQEDFRILLVEDNRVSQVMTSALLKKFNYHVTCANHGREALSLLNSGEWFHLILMDCKMPILDGYETTRIIRQEEKISGKHIPIIALTADASNENLEQCLQVGMDDFIGKPLNIYVMEWTIRQYILDSFSSQKRKNSQAA